MQKEIFILFCFSEILQFKSERGVNEQMLAEHDDAVVQKKSKSIMIDRNQYSMGGESDGGFSFNDRSDDTNPAVKNEGFAFRYYIMNVYLLCFFARYKKLNIRIYIFSMKYMSYIKYFVFIA